MSSIRVSDRLRSKRFKTGNATAEDKAYVEKKYCGECDMNGYVSPFPPGEDPYFKEWTYTPLPSNYVEKKAQKKPKRALSKGKQKKEKSEPTSIYETDYYANAIATGIVAGRELPRKMSDYALEREREREKERNTVATDRLATISKAAREFKKKEKAQAKFEEDMSKVVLEKERCETLMKEALEVKKPTLIIEEDEDNEVVEETFTQNDAIYLNSLIQDRTNKMRNLLKLDEEIERLQKKRANHVSEKCVEMTPERFRKALFELGYIKK